VCTVPSVASSFPAGRPPYHESKHVEVARLESVPEPPVSVLHLVHFYKGGQGSSNLEQAVAALASDAAKGGWLKVLAVDCSTSGSKCLQAGISKLPAVQVTFRRLADVLVT
jgi:hypothetical protein